MLQAFQKKMKGLDEEHKQREKAERPYSASNIYHNITIYANNSVNNNNISINSSSGRVSRQSEREEEAVPERNPVEELKLQLAKRDKKLKEVMLKLEASKRNEEQLMKQVLQLSKKQHDTAEE